MAVNSLCCFGGDREAPELLFQLAATSVILSGMRVAVIGDIHGNMPALDAVMNDLREQRPDEILVCGDLVGRGPQGHAVAQRIREMGWPSVQGNHEDFLIRIRRKQLKATDLEPKSWPALEFMAYDLTPEDEAYLDALPFSMCSSLHEDVRLVHGTPDSFTRGVGYWTREDDLKKHWNAVDERVLVCGHTHRPLKAEVGTGLIVNTGSVGLPFNGDSRAQYVILSKVGSEWEVEFRTIEYDRNALMAIYESSGFLEKGGIYAWLLKREVETAHPHLVPYMKWCQFTAQEFSQKTLDTFLDIFPPAEGIGFFAQFKHLAQSTA